MSNVPDHISFDDLVKLKDIAVSEEKAHEVTEGPYDGKTKEQVIALADKILDDTLEECGDPIIHKLMAMKIIAKLGLWNNSMGQDILEDSGNIATCQAWTRDAGILQGAYQLVRMVGVSDDDWLIDDPSDIHID